jgi:hypothetical protein
MHGIGGVAGSMFGPFSQYDGVWAEITRSEHGHGGPGWELEACI